MVKSPSGEIRSPQFSSSLPDALLFAENTNMSVSESSSCLLSGVQFASQWTLTNFLMLDFVLGEGPRKALCKLQIWVFHSKNAKSRSKTWNRKVGSGVCKRTELVFRVSKNDTILVKEKMFTKEKMFHDSAHLRSRMMRQSSSIYFKNRKTNWKIKTVLLSESSSVSHRPHSSWWRCCSVPGSASWTTPSTTPCRRRPSPRALRVVSSTRVPTTHTWSRKPSRSSRSSSTTLASPTCSAVRTFSISQTWPGRVFEYRRDSSTVIQWKDLCHVSCFTARGCAFTHCCVCVVHL